MADYESTQQEFIPNITKVYDSITDIMDFCVLCGWTLHDDQTSASDKYFIIKSAESVTDYRESPCYVGFKVFNSQQYYLRMFLFVHWDNTDQTYQGLRRYHNSYNYWDSDTIYHDQYSAHTVMFNTTGVNNLNLYGNRYYINLLLHRASDDTYVGGQIFKLMDTVYDYKFTVLNNIESGSFKTIQLEENQARKLKLDDSLFLLCKDNHTFSKINIKDINITDDTVVAEEVYWPTVSGSYLGSTIQVYPWVVKIDNDKNSSSSEGDPYYYRTFMCYDYSSVDNYYKDNSHYSGQLSTSAYVFPSSSTTTPLYSVGGRANINDMIYGQQNELFGYNDYIKAGPGSNRDTVGYNLNCAGTATSGTDDMLIDLSKSWVDDELEHKCIIITDGMSAGDVLSIISNTATTATISGTFTNPPDNTTEYGVYDVGYIKVDNDTFSSSYSYLLRIT